MENEKFSYGLKVGKLRQIHVELVESLTPDIIKIRPYAMRKPIVSFNISTPSAINLMEGLFYALSEIGAIKPPQIEVKQKSTEFHSFLPDPPHPFLFALDALITDPALGKETHKRLEVAAKYFKDNSSL